MRLCKFCIGDRVRRISPGHRVYEGTVVGVCESLVFEEYWVVQMVDSNGVSRWFFETDVELVDEFAEIVREIRSNAGLV